MKYPIGTLVVSGSAFGIITKVHKTKKSLTEGTIYEIILINAYIRDKLLKHQDSWDYLTSDEDLDKIHTWKVFKGRR
jgi:hypothetical protein